MANVLMMQDTPELPEETKVSKQSWFACAGKPSNKSRFFC